LRCIGRGVFVAIPDDESAVGGEINDTGAADVERAGAGRFGPCTAAELVVRADEVEFAAADVVGAGAALVADVQSRAVSGISACGLDPDSAAGLVEGSLAAEITYLQPGPKADRAARDVERADIGIAASGARSDGEVGDGRVPLVCAIAPRVM